MTSLAFSVVDCRPAAQTAAPAIVFRLRIENAGDGRIHAMLLRCQARIEPCARQHTEEEADRLYELFGERSQWDRTLRPVVWTQTAVAVPSFGRSVEVDVPMPCTYDLEVAAAKYFHGIRGGEIPLLFLFTGTIFQASQGAFSVEPIAWECEAPFRMPASVWHDALSRFFAGEAWIRIDRDTLDALQAFRGRQAFTSWDATLRELLTRRATAEPV